MSGRSRQDVRRQLFRGIGSRMSSNNHNNNPQQQQKLGEAATTQQPPELVATASGGSSGSSASVAGKSKRYGLGSSKYRVITPIPSRSHRNAGLTPSTVSSSSTVANSEMGSGRTDKLVIHRHEDLDLVDYDYRTFSSRHPLRASSVRAWEQAESAAGVLFSRERDLDEPPQISTSSGLVLVEDANPVIQLPGVSKPETDRLMRLQATGTSAFAPPPQDLFEQAQSKDRRGKRRLSLLAPRESTASRNAYKLRLDALYEAKPDVVGEMDVDELSEMKQLNDQLEAELDELRVLRRLQRLDAAPSYDHLSDEATPAKSKIQADSRRQMLKTRLDEAQATDGWFQAQPQLAEDY
ncbi:unnamed protein product [Kuraishia capsulata CBS 1993]|uniref:Uncharacterized protein n=1 Tax=Kuraishia capsulata CBS 1993 TaxID=1382522 RepID=W6MN00_9ASCO|nr:uncharacterized protein KUCA_T00003576001 [Kuraishia capsulata CBS 1993]CDK27598.1 unnamed protein product [Kuraishia capsulata CBS 1993]